ncbi:patatin-like phospholipase family protein [Natranaerobius thermophilus]|uniref:patatin-like phospholipase family protein n=1 Tax=Natranaerobius thermophilus TaxID=375929 RepID=UPI0039C8702E
MVILTKKIGLALSAGSARGLAHIGVLKTLIDNNIPIDCIAGTSMGSMVGGLYAAGIPIDIIEGLSLNLTQKKWVDIGVPRKGFIRGDKVLQILRMLTKDSAIENTKIPFGCVATELNTGERIVYKQGNLAEAIRASISIPGVFTPYEYEGKTLVDGALVDRLPVSLCRALGADCVISVDVSTHVSNASITNIFDVIVQSMNIMQAEMLKERREDSDILIRPDVQSITPNQFQKAEEAIEAGKEACQEVLPALKQVVEEC